MRFQSLDLCLLVIFQYISILKSLISTGRKKKTERGKKIEAFDICCRLGEVGPAILECLGIILSLPGVGKSGIL